MSWLGKNTNLNRCDTQYDSYMDFSTISDNRQNVSFTSEFAEISPIILPCYLLLRMFITMMTCKHQLHLPAALLWALLDGESGWIATQVIKTVSSEGRLRRWQWELRKNKRPPCLGCWKIESIGSSDRNGDFEARDRGNGWSD
eukprot:scaffold1064_cov209-Skeletonema_marinoi.AAC.13